MTPLATNRFGQKILVPYSLRKGSWYKASDIAENKWFFGYTRKGFLGFLRSLKHYQYGPIKLKVRHGQHPNSPIFIKGESLIKLISYIEKYRANCP